MLISIVTISYNQRKYLQEALESVLKQDHNQIDYVVVDPGSTDGSQQLILAHERQISKIVFESDRGAADGLNKGFSFAKGDVFGFLNSDDILLPGALKTISDYFQTHPDVDVVCGNGFRIDGDGHILSRVRATRFGPKLYAYGLVNIFQQSTFFRRTAFEKIGGFNIQNRTCWDGELFLRMAMSGASFGTINRDLAGFRLHEDSISGSGRLNEPYKIDSDRLFQLAMGRKKRHGDQHLQTLLRPLKFAINPNYFWQKLLDARTTLR